MENHGTLKVYLYVVDRRDPKDEDVFHSRTRRVTLLTRRCVTQQEADAILSTFLKDNSLFNDNLHPVEAMWTRQALIYPLQY